MASAYTDTNAVDHHSDDMPFISNKKRIDLAKLVSEIGVSVRNRGQSRVYLGRDLKIAPTEAMDGVGAIFRSRNPALLY